MINKTENTTQSKNSAIISILKGILRVMGATILRELVKKIFKKLGVRQNIRHQNRWF